jgi:hypothetical protein
VAGRTLHVRCATWAQVETFTTRKLRRGKLLSMKVPFVGKAGAHVTLGLELPNEMVMAIDGIIQKASPVEGDAQRTWIEIELTGLTEEVMARIKNLAASANDDQQTDPQIVPVPPVRKSAVMSVVGEDLPADERELFQKLSGELRKLRQAPAHEVLGVPREPSPEQLRTAWKALVRRHHPDLVIRRNAPAITHLAEELTILSNRAYDRLRAAITSEGAGITAGSMIATPPGWLVGFEDIQSHDTTPAPKGAPRRFERASTAQPVTPPPVPAAPSAQGSDAFELRARAMLAEGDANTAREVLAAALVVYPRSKPLRSLYYVATALAALQDGEVVLATSQLETALAHHDQCTEAAKVLDHVRKHGAANTDRLRAVFQ